MTKRNKIDKKSKSVTDRQTNGRTDGRPKRDVESRANEYKS